jgi:hypothetical protein
MFATLIASSLCISGLYTPSSAPTTAELVAAGADPGNIPVVYVLDRCEFMDRFGKLRGAVDRGALWLPDDWRYGDTILSHELAHLGGKDECAALQVELDRAIEQKAWATARRIASIGASSTDRCELK